MSFFFYVSNHQLSPIVSQKKQQKKKSWKIKAGVCKKSITSLQKSFVSSLFQHHCQRSQYRTAPVPRTRVTELSCGKFLHFVYKNGFFFRNERQIFTLLLCFLVRNNFTLPLFFSVALLFFCV